MIFINQGMLLLGSNHFLTITTVAANFAITRGGKIGKRLKIEKTDQHF